MVFRIASYGKWRNFFLLVQLSYLHHSVLFVLNLLFFNCNIDSIVHFLAIKDVSLRKPHVFFGWCSFLHPTIILWMTVWIQFSLQLTDSWVREPFEANSFSWRDSRFLLFSFIFNKQCYCILRSYRLPSVSLFTVYYGNYTFLFSVFFPLDVQCVYMEPIRGTWNLF